MNTVAILRIALASLRRTPLRSALTSLGVIIGVASVIGMIGIGNGAKAQVEDMFAHLNKNVITLTTFTPMSEWRNGQPPKLPPRERLTPADYRAIQQYLDGNATTSVQIYMRSNQARANGRRSEPVVLGIDVAGFDLLGRQIVSGSSFGTTEVNRAASVCLISNTLANGLFAGDDAIGKVVNVNGIPFVVTGVVADKEEGKNPMRPEAGDIEIFVPYTSLLQRLDREGTISILVKANNLENLPLVQQGVSDAIEQRRGSRKVEFSPSLSIDAIRFYSEGSRTMALLLAAIAAISLVVGGVGIMNIMLVTVTERTREIGIRLALGTRCRDILRQYVAEALALSVAGGAPGIVLGIGVTHVVTTINDWPSRITINSVLFAFLSSAGVGVLFGYYPARRAAQMNPIEALRAE